MDEEIIKILEVSPKYQRIHEMPIYLSNKIRDVLINFRYFGIYQSMSELIERLPEAIKKDIKSGEKKWDENELRGLKFDMVFIDEVIKNKDWKGL